MGIMVYFLFWVKAGFMSSAVRMRLESLRLRLSRRQGKFLLQLAKAQCVIATDII